MQFQKEEIKDRILTAAREEFLSKGYEKASIRNITRTAKTSKSNVYNYFHDKDALFAAVVEPTLSGITDGMAALRSQNPGTRAATYSMASQKNVMVGIINFVFSHAADFKLLLFRSSGSSLADFKSQVTDTLSDVLADWLAHAAPEQGVSIFFIHAVAGFYIGTLEQMLAQDLPRPQASGQFEVFLKFVYGGWNTVLNGQMATTEKKVE